MTTLPPLPSEQMLIDHLDRMSLRPIDSAVVMSPGRGQAGWMLAEKNPETKVINWFVDSHRAAKAKQTGEASVAVVCGPDLPERTFDLAMLPILKTGEAEMNRDLMHQAWQRLPIGGVLMTSVNAPGDTWLLGQMQSLGDKVRCHDTDAGRVYVSRKTNERTKQKTFDAEFTFRAGDRVLAIHSRPSVFSHRSVDRAAAAMIRHVPIPIGADVLELGCGNGAVAMAAAIATQTGRVYAIDCNTRAVQCVTRAAIQNGIENLTAIVNHDGELPQVPDCDVALLNPPYYGDFRIAHHFVQTAARILRIGGDAYVVTKQTDHYLQTDWWPMEMTGQQQAQSYDILRLTRRE